MAERPLRGLLVVHYHLRPGGVRSIIATALPTLAAAGDFDRILLLSGEAPDPSWFERLRSACGPVPLELVIEPAANYWPDAREALAPAAPHAIGERLEMALAKASRGCRAIWAHNLSVGRNILLAKSIQQICAKTGIPVLNHHHDFFFDARWGRWTEFVSAGLESFDEVLAAIFLDGCRTADITVNSADARLLSEREGRRPCRWLPNPVVLAPQAKVGSRGAIRRWLRALATGVDGGPLWLIPGRLLRRKNIAEGILLARIHNREGMLVVTGGASSVDELAYAAALEAAVKRGGCPVVFGALQKPGAPTPGEAMAAADALLTPSIREGFGLTLIEGAMAKRPHLVRRRGVPFDDLSALGLKLPSIYDDLLVPATMIDVEGESARAASIFDRWLDGLPRELRSAAEGCWREPGRAAAIPFNALTLQTQTELLGVKARDLQAEIDAANPALSAAIAKLCEPSRLAPSAIATLCPSAFVRALLDLLTALENLGDGSRIKLPSLRERIVHRAFAEGSFLPNLCTWPARKSPKSRHRLKGARRLGGNG